MLEKMEKNLDYISAFSALGRSKFVDKEVEEHIERYVCNLYGRPKLHSVNKTRLTFFWDKHNKQNKIIEMCMLPPCQGNLCGKYKGPTPLPI